MKFCYIIFLSFFCSTVGNAQKVISTLDKPDSILAAVHKKLNSLNTISYDNTRELNYSSEQYQYISKWSCFFDFKTSNTLTRFRYQIKDENFHSFFNGTEKFDLNLKRKTISIKENPPRSDFESGSPFYNSIVTLKNILPLIIADKASIKKVYDTTIEDKTYVLVDINMGKRTLQNLGFGFNNLTGKRNVLYKIIIDKKTFLPYSILQKNDENNDFVSTTFLNIEINAALPNERSWYYSSYLNDYKRIEEKTKKAVNLTGSQAHDWILKTYNGKESVSLANLKGNIILLDFFIKNCGPCIESVPYLNKI